MLYSCPKCGSENVDMMVDITLVTDAKYAHNLSKKALYAKKTEVWGAYWDRAHFFCKNPDCGHNVVAPDPWWYTEVKKLREENKELKERLEANGV